MKTPLPRISVATLALQFEAESPLELPPYAGRVLRGALGRALRALTCVSGVPDCEGCPLVAGCPFGLLYEPHTTPDLPKRMGTAPVPSVFRSPFDGRARRIEAAERFTFEVQLFGQGRAQVINLINAARHAGQRGLGAADERGVARLIAAHLTGERRQRVYSSAGGLQYFDASDARRRSPFPEEDEAATLELRTPLHIRARVDGARRSLRRFEPVPFFKRLSGRLSALSLVHQGFDAEWDYRGLHAAAERVEILDERLEVVEGERHSGRGRPHKVPMLGVLGRVRLTNLSPGLAGLLPLAAEVHVGSDTQFGFGQIEVRW